MSTGTMLKIVDHVQDQNLTQVGHNQIFLEKTAKEFKLRHRQAVLFSNRANDKFRLVACFYGMPVLILPPVSREKKLSLYLTVSRFLRYNFGMNALLLRSLEDEIATTKGRIQKQKNRIQRAKALQRRKR